MDAVAARVRADREQDIAYTVRGSLDEVLLFENPNAHRVDERIAGIAGREIHLAAERRHANAIAVVADAADDSGEQVAIARFVERAEPQAVQQCDRPRTHGEDIAQDSAGAGRGALERLDRRRVIVRFDLEGDRPAVREAQHTSVLPGTLDDLGPAGGEVF